MQLHELYETYEAVRQDGGIEFAMTPDGDAAWESRLDELEKAIPRTEPKTITDALESLAAVERALEAGHGEMKADLLAAMIANCRQVIADIHWRQ